LALIFSAVYAALGASGDTYKPVLAASKFQARIGKCAGLSRIGARYHCRALASRGNAIPKGRDRIDITGLLPPVFCHLM